MEAFLKSYKVLVCAGTGGVGKTTIAASLGVLAASKGLTTLVLTIDPARRLATALGIAQSDDIIKVPLQVVGPSGELWAGMIHPEKIFESFVRTTASTPEAAERLLRNRLYQQLSTTLSGSQEFTSLERVLSALEANKYDLILLDTPPSQHAIDFLRAPQKIFNLFQESVTKWFVQSEESNDFFGKLFSQGTKTALKALQKLTGAKFINELSDFFESVSALQTKVRQRSIKLHQMLASDETGFLLVTGADEVKLKEAEDFRRELMLEGHHFTGVVLNRTSPAWNLRPSMQFEASKWTEVEQIYKRMADFYSSRESSYDNLKRNVGQGLVLKVPELKGNLSGLEALMIVAQKIERSYKQENSND